MRDFISKETREFRFKMGSHIASSLTGFVVGVIVASIAWSVGAWYFQQVQQIASPSPAISHTANAPVRPK